MLSLVLSQLGRGIVRAWLIRLIGLADSHLLVPWNGLLAMLINPKKLCIEIGLAWLD